MAQEETLGQICYYLLTSGIMRSVNAQGIFYQRFVMSDLILRSVCNKLGIDFAQHLRRSKTSSTLLREPKILQT